MEKHSLSDEFGLSGCAALAEQGHHQEAEVCFRHCILLRPDSAEAHCMLANLLSAQGRVTEATTCYRQASLLQPQSALPFYHLGNLLRTSQPAESESCYRRAIELEANFAAAHCNLGSLLGKHDRLGEAEACYRAALGAEPSLAEAHNNLGKVIQKQRRWSEAEACYRRAISLKESGADCHYNLGDVLLAQNRLEEAETSLSRSIELKVAFAEAHGKLGRVLMRLGSVEKAEASLRRAIQHKPNLTAAIYDLAGLLYQQGQLDEAVDLLRKVIQLNPNSAISWLKLGNVSGTQGKIREEEDCYRRALQLQPNLAAAHSHLANILKKDGKLEQARNHYERAIAIAPQFVEAICNLGALLQETGNLADAEACYRRSLTIAPDAAVVHSNLLNCLLHAVVSDTQALLAEHNKFGEHFERAARFHRAHANTRDPDRTLQIGFVSCDFRAHPVATLIEPILSHLTKDPSFTLHAFVSQTVEDEVSVRIRGHFDHWRRVAHLSDAALAEMIANQAIDILIDLSGHMSGNRLLTFTRKPAPIQASWIAYLGTTGLATMDYYFGDRFLLPSARLREQFLEKLIYLPSVVSYAPREDAPGLTPLPALTNGYLTFGSFNRASKLTQEAILLWAKLLLAIPSSRLIVANLPAMTVAEKITNWMAAAGVAPDRVTAYLTCEPVSYFRLFSTVDICLDSFPYTGMTTTLDALWMGCPTLTISGCTPPGMQSTALLSHAGLHDFIAADEDEFVVKGLRVASDQKTLCDIRRGCRARVQQSILGRPEAIAAGLGGALRTMWRRWCQGDPPDLIDASV